MGSFNEDLTAYIDFAEQQALQVLPKLTSPTRPIWLIYPQRQFIPKRLEVFIEWVMGIFAQRSV